MAHQELGKHSWPVQSLITQNVHLSEFLVQNQCRSSLVKGQGWSESCSLWQGKRYFFHLNYINNIVLTNFIQWRKVHNTLIAFSEGEYVINMLLLSVLLVFVCEMSMGEFLSDVQSIKVLTDPSMHPSSAGNQISSNSRYN